MIRRETPEVISGARGPRDVRNAQADEQRSKRTLGAKAPAGKIRFQSRYANLRIQLTAPPDLRDPFTGRVNPGRPKAAQFRDHILDVGENETETLQILKDHPAFGRTFWLWSEMIEQARKAQVESTKQQLAADPEFRARILEALKESNSEDFSLPSNENV